MPWIPAILIRILTPLTVLKYPFWGSIAGTIADMVDVVIWNALGVQNLGAYYNLWDKGLDNYFYIIQGIVVLRFKNKLVKRTLLFLLIYRLIGATLFEFTQIRTLLFIFPNVFVTYFIIYTGLKAYWRKEPIKTWKQNAIFLGLITIPKLYQEYLFHVVEINIFQFFMSLI